MSYKYFVGHFAYHQELFGGGENWITVLRVLLSLKVTIQETLLRGRSCESNRVSIVRS